MFYVLLFLFYVYDVLELYIDVLIMEIYYSKYYQIYVNNLNVVLEGMFYVEQLVESLLW